MASSALAYAAKDVLLDHYYPSVYKKAAAQPVVPGKVVFYEQKLSQMPDAYDQLWKRVSEDPRLTARYVTAAQNDSSKLQFIRNCAAALREIATAEIVFLNDASNVVSCVPLRPETTAIQLWHACGAFKKWGMSTADLQFGESREQQLLHPYYENLSLVTTSSPEVNWAYAEAMNLKGRNQIIQALGVSRTDVFFDPEFLQDARRAIEQQVPQAAGKKVILYAPTYRGTAPAAIGPDQLDFAAMAKALAPDYVLLIKHHPFVKNRPAIPLEAQDFAFDVTSDLPIDVLLAAADLCITDYSSVVFEFSLLERPLIFFAYDKEDYDDWRGFYYDYDELTPGPVYDNTQQIIDYILAVDQVFDPAEVQAFKLKFMSACDGHATDRIMSFVDERLQTGSGQSDGIE